MSGGELIEGGRTKGSLEGSRALEGASQSQRKQPIVKAPLNTPGTGRWLYERLKRSTSKIRIISEMEHKTISEAEHQYALFVDFTEADSLLKCAVVEHQWDQLTSTFGNGSVVEFRVERRNL